MTLHQANEMDALLARLQSLREDFDRMAEDLAQLRAEHEADNAGDEWKEAE